MFFSASASFTVSAILIPKNKKDLVDIPEDVIGQIEVILCDRIEQVLANVLTSD